MKRGDLLTRLASGQLTGQLRPVYGEDAPAAAGRLAELAAAFADTFPCTDETDTLLFSAPGRTELGGNHTDHQNGRCLAASVELDTIACVAPNDSGVIRIQSRHHSLIQVDLADLAIHPEETGTSAALVRGIAARFQALGRPLRGFDAYTTTRVLRGSGLSSSAAFEVLTAAILDHLCGGGPLTATQLARIGQYAENVYFGKPCGLMDQLACATGGVIAIDFQDPAAPQIRQLDLSPETFDHALCIIDSRASHADLTADFAAIPREMRQVAALLGCEVLGQVDPAEFFAVLPRLRARCGDRALLRARHFFDENRRVTMQHAALERGDFQTFLTLVAQSGRSSWMYLQNVYPGRADDSQPLALILAHAEQLLRGRGACRVHGGGFAGTVQAYVPLDMLSDFVAGMEALTGPGSCHVLRFRGVGAAVLVE